MPRDLHDYKVILSNPYESDLNWLRSGIRKPDTYLLPFDYGDITDLIVPPGKAVDEMVSIIQDLPIDDLAKNSLQLKIRVI